MHHGPNCKTLGIMHMNDTMKIDAVVFGIVTGVGGESYPLPPSSGVSGVSIIPDWIK